MNIYIRKNNEGYYIITSDQGKRLMYLYYTKREVIKRYKAVHGWTGKHGINIVDYTKEVY